MNASQGYKRGKAFKTVDELLTYIENHNPSVWDCSNGEACYRINASTDYLFCSFSLVSRLVKQGCLYRAERL